MGGGKYYRKLGAGLWVSDSSTVHNRPLKLLLAELWVLTRVPGASGHLCWAGLARGWGQVDRPAFSPLQRSTRTSRCNRPNRHLHYLQCWLSYLLNYPEKYRYVADRNASPATREIVHSAGENPPTLWYLKSKLLSVNDPLASQVILLPNKPLPPQVHKYYIFNTVAIWRNRKNNTVFFKTRKTEN